MSEHCLGVVCQTLPVPRYKQPCVSPGAYNATVPLSYTTVLISNIGSRTVCSHTFREVLSGATVLISSICSHTFREVLSGSEGCCAPDRCAEPIRNNALQSHGTCEGMGCPRPPAAPGVCTRRCDHRGPCEQICAGAPLVFRDESSSRGMRVHP